MGDGTLMTLIYMIFADMILLRHVTIMDNYYKP